MRCYCFIEESLTYAGERNVEYMNAYRLERYRRALEKGLSVEQLALYRIWLSLPLSERSDISILRYCVRGRLDEYGYFVLPSLSGSGDILRVYDNYGNGFWLGLRSNFAEEIDLGFIVELESDVELG